MTRLKKQECQAELNLEQARSDTRQASTRAQVVKAMNDDAFWSKRLYDIRYEIACS